jgi:hypothetical protein
MEVRAIVETRAEGSASQGRFSRTRMGRGLNSKIVKSDRIKHMFGVLRWRGVAQALTSKEFATADCPSLKGPTSVGPARLRFRC